MGQTAFHSALQSRAGPGVAAEVENFIAIMDSTAEGDVLTVRFQADGEHMEVDASWRTSGSCVVKSRALWLAFQQAYLDKDSEYPAIKMNALRHLPEIVFGESYVSSCVSSNEGSALAEENLARVCLSVQRQGWVQVRRRNAGGFGKV